MHHRTLKHHTGAVALAALFALTLNSKAGTAPTMQQPMPPPPTMAESAGGVGFYARVGASYQQASSYHSGRDSFAGFVFDQADGSYRFYNVNLDVSLGLPSGFYIASGFYTTAAEVKTNGLGLGVPDTDTSLKPREVPLALGFQHDFGFARAKFEARYTFNIDRDFDRPFGEAVQRSVLLPVTDGSDYLTLSAQGETEAFGLRHTGTVSFTRFESGVSHPIFPSFQLGNRYALDYQVAKPIGALELRLGHLFVWSEDTKGVASPITGTAYLYERPRWQEVRGGVAVQVNPNFGIDLTGRYIYDGSDAPKETTLSLGLELLF